MHTSQHQFEVKNASSIKSISTNRANYPCCNTNRASCFLLKSKTANLENLGDERMWANQTATDQWPPCLAGQGNQESFRRGGLIMTPQINSSSGMAGAGASNSINSGANYTNSSIESQFRQAMQAVGIHYSGEIIADGKLHRFHIEGHKKGTLNGAYTLHLDGHPAGWFMDHTRGLSQKWRSGNGYRAMSHANIKQINEAKQQREAEQPQKHAAAAERAENIWRILTTPIAKQSEHNYLANKHIQPHGARLYHDALVIPIYNESDQLVNLQFIDNDGDKKFLPGGRKRGCFYIIGDLSQRILIAEGFATGASLFEESGQRVVVAFDAGNLLPVAKAVRELAPDNEIIICGDNDVSGVGQAKAREAASSIDGKVLIPPTPGMDWNDYLVGGCHE